VSGRPGITRALDAEGHNAAGRFLAAAAVRNVALRENAG
jgi:hypothetical protein